jgi:hypothetical protein
MRPDNLRIHTRYKTAGELAPNPALVPFPVQALHLLTPAIHHALVCLSLNHFIHTLPSSTDRAVVAPNRWKMYHHRGAALRALSRHIGQDKTRCSDMTITTILMFMCLEVSRAYLDGEAPSQVLTSTSRSRILPLRTGVRMWMV